MLRFIATCPLVCLTSCNSTPLDLPSVTIDMRPVECGYKWFQTGTSPALERSCELPRSDELKTQQEILANDHAWQIAKERCPTACPPRELYDPSDWEEPFPNGSCREGRVRYTARVFFECGVMR